jgi:beta-glucanase (GH16 family)
MSDSLSLTPVWQDEFAQPVGSAPDPRKWVHDLGCNGWGNAELQKYTALPENVRIVADAAATGGRALQITALALPEGGFSSARLNTQGKFSILHGRIETRLRLPQGQGIWPAFWMLGDGFGTVPWPDCGEIDIMEMVGHQPGTLYGTLHGPGYSGAHGISLSTMLPAGTVFADAYHVFAVDWRPGRIDWLLDGQVFHTLTAADLPKGTKWVFDDTSFFLLINLAVGGKWPGYPDATTRFPQEYRIDYVRVYRHE